MNLKFINMKTIKLIIILIGMGAFHSMNISAQNNQTIAILDIDAINTLYKGSEITRLLRLEAKKLKKEMILDIYDMKETFAENSFNDTSCYSKNCGIKAGELLNADKVVTGSIEKFGSKIIISLNLIDVQSKTIINQDVSEFINKEDETQRMLRVSIQKLMTGQPEEQLMAELTYIELPIKNPNNIINLNGPRMGIGIISGDGATRLMADRDVGGFEMLGFGNTAITSSMGYQYEERYIATKNFQALVEFIGLVSGMETGKFNPSITILNGFRFSKANWEIGFGPSFKLKRVADGYYDDNNVWHREQEWDPETNGSNPYEIERNVLDSRGNFAGDMGMVFAFGRTFQSGRLNIPLNLYVAPRKSGTTIGLSLGFNIQNQK